ncbi:MAG TPA: YfhO family protein [Tenuifilaceae bacterium]|jgi:hypothetical protein|nr:YfhO family protein [Bacteroidales bacterium]MDI9515955.1 YfhO family protein [Bacteroidota bacterium]NLH56323.1 YfhO family protein [Rikenellaceae bacterium]OQC64228.1 MAG: Bacterial membrane protein YfhO [Bacteroidetes bacterium ADurb.Bin008]HNV80815.1 YfhO family protein [Tenuifilaceae bacterium]
MKTLLKNSYPHLIAIAIFLITSYIYFFPLLEGKGLQQHDIEQFRGSAREIIEHREKYGEEPLWTNSMFSGMPAYLISTKYTGNLLNRIDYLLQFGKRPASTIFFTLVGFYILLLVLGVNPWLSIVGAFAYALSSYFFIIITAGHNAKMHAISYVAPMIAGLILTLKGKHLSGLALFALFLGLNLDAGHVQITYYAAFIMLAIGIAHLAGVIRKKEYVGFSKAIGVLAIAALLAVGANFSRLYFTWESGKYSIRGPSELTSEKENKASGLDRGYALDWSYGVGETFNLLIPNLMGGSSMDAPGANSEAYSFLRKHGYPHGQAIEFLNASFRNYWGPQPMTMGPVYIGAIVFFLFFLALFLIKGPYKWAILGVTILAIMLAWGRNFMPLTNLFFNYFPGYNKFRTVSMILYIAELTIPLLGIMAVKKIYDGEVGKSEFLKAFKWALGITGGLCLFFILFGGSVLTFLNEHELSFLSEQQGTPYFDLFEAIKSDRKSLMQADALRSLAFILLGAGALLGFYFKKIKPPYFIALLGLFIVSDMWVVNRRYLNSKNFIPINKVEKPFSPSKADEQILADKALYYRVYNLTVSPFNDASTSYFHKSIGGYHGAKLMRYQEIINHHITKGNMAVLNMLNTKYLIERGEQGPVARINPDALGNAWFTDSIIMVNNADEEIQALNNFDPATTAIVDKRFAHLVESYNPSPDGNDWIRLTNYKANELIYSYNLASPRLAIFSDIYYPAGWTALVDGKPATYFRANYILRAMVLQPGSHEVIFRFKPRMFTIGHFVDLTSSLLILLLLMGACYTGYSALRRDEKIKEA